MSYKDFDAALAEASGEPITFKLGGEEFSVIGVNAGPILRLGRMASAKDADALAEFEQFLLSIISEEDHDRWQKALNKVPATALLELVQYLIEESTGRPTPQLSDLPEQLPTTTPKSNTDSTEAVTS